MSNANTTDSLDNLNALLKSLLHNKHIVINAVHNVELRTKWSLPLRRLDDFVLAFIRSGNGYYTIEGQQIAFEAGHIILITPETEFLANQGTMTPSLLSIRFSLIPNNFQSQLEPIAPFYIHHVPQSVEACRDLFHHAYSAYLSDNNPLAENAYVSLILESIQKERQNKTETTTYDSRLESAKVYIQKNPSKAITIEELSHIANLSLPYFSKKFKEQYSLTPKSFLFKTRMEYAKELLCEYRYSVTEVADILHYSDPFIFSNQYKKFWRQMPSKAKRL